MGIEYSVIEIFTSEEARYRGKPFPEAVIEMVRKKKIAARCMVTKGTAACYENGEQVTQRIVALSFNMPIKIEIVFPAAEKDAILAAVVEMTTEGIVGIRDLHVHRHQTRNRLIPRHFLVEAAMTSQPEKVYAHTSLADVIQLLLPAFFTGLPVVNADDTPIGIITHGDLVYRAGLPIRPGLLKSTGENNLTGILDSLRTKTATEIMSSPVTTIEASKPLTAAV
jgi:CBS domain-containing protein